VRNFMLTFGPLSSLFDLAAFALLYFALHTPAAVFQSAWFVQSPATQVLVIFVIRHPGLHPGYGLARDHEHRCKAPSCAA